MSLLQTELRGKLLSLGACGSSIKLPLTSAIAHKRQYATNRRQVTIINDDGRVNWSDLSKREKVARSTQQSFNFGLVMLGIVMTGGVTYFLFSDVFSAESKTSYFNRSVSRIKASPECIDALGPANRMIFYGESPRSSFRRARMAEPTPISEVSRNDRTKTDTIKMKFLVKGDKAEGWATMHLEKKVDEIEYHYVTLSVDVPGMKRIYLEGAPSLLQAPKTIFGVNWGRR